MKRLCFIVVLFSLLLVREYQNKARCDYFLESDDAIKISEQFLKDDFEILLPVREYSFAHGKFVQASYGCHLSVKQHMSSEGDAIIVNFLSRDECLLSDTLKGNGVFASKRQFINSAGKRSTVYGIGVEGEYEICAIKWDSDQSYSLMYNHRLFVK